MLDECKGEKFEEVLAAFSTLILHKRVAAEKQHNTTVAKRLALAPMLKSGERKSLLPLAIAHRASLTTLLHRKEQLRSRYQEIQRLLDEKRQIIRQKHEHVLQAGKAYPTPGVSERSHQRLRQRYDTHWQGDPIWLDTILNGNMAHGHDALLEMPFNDTWRRVAGGAHLHIPAGSKQENLLRDLESRVATQQARLQQWRAYREMLAADTKRSTSEAWTVETTKLSQNPTIDFSTHKKINERQTELLQNLPRPGADRHYAAKLPMDEEYARLVKSMQRDLDDIDKPKEHIPIIPGRQGLSRSSAINPQSALKLLDTPAVRPRRNNDQPFKREESLGREKLFRSQGQREISSTTFQNTKSPGLKGAVAAPMNDTPEVHGLNSTLKSEEQIPWTRLTGTTLDDHSIVENDEDSVLAAQIITATMNAGASPIISKPSLLERTRRSMAFASPGHNYELFSESADQETQHGT